jgi:hypothetical protein
LRWLSDRNDERRAHRLRATLGRRQWLVSWEHETDGVEDDGHWRARLSCPTLDSTLERTGRTRTRAIEHAARSLTLLLSLRAEIERRAAQLGDDLDSTDEPWR